MHDLDLLSWAQAFIAIAQLCILRILWVMHKSQQERWETASKFVFKKPPPEKTPEEEESEAIERLLSYKRTALKVEQAWQKELEAQQARPE